MNFHRNELPQILNVLLGKISIIGRRPTVQEHFDFYDEEVKNVLSKFKPALSGISSIDFMDDKKYFIGKIPDEIKNVYLNKIAPFKGELEIWYCQKQFVIVNYFYQYHNFIYRRTIIKFAQLFF